MATALRLRDGFLRFVPSLVLLTALVVFALLAFLAPGAVTGAVYRIDTPGFSVSHLDLTCAPDDAGMLHCPIDVAGRRLTVRTDPAPLGGVCRAWFDGRQLSCDKAGEYNLGSPWLRLDGPVLPEAETAGLRSDFPWWHDVVDRYWPLAVLVVTVALALIAAVLAFLASGRPHLPHPKRGWYTAVVGAGVVLVLVLAGGATMGTRLWWILVVPLAPGLVPLLVMPVWQWYASGGSDGRVGTRTKHTAVAFLSALVSGFVLVGLVTFLAGMPD
ncbi:hypothetical protein GCM10022243_22320 [Saccharothrix violaceirubra]|uniref:Uncharacterized protein n=1 Tax=Saccharothrix violaceirubra TaxID=413306 RepID=A0A7W7WVE0_9PSEU|nr:hypothetical protein [Saccharothrix violaceirubra]MBB4964832.1 hypothetical protein [Saccharothrix violaceirubra]